MGTKDAEMGQVCGRLTCCRAGMGQDYLSGSLYTEYLPCDVAIWVWSYVKSLPCRGLVQVLQTQSLSNINWSFTISLWHYTNTEIVNLESLLYVSYCFANGLAASSSVEVDQVLYAWLHPAACGYHDSQSQDVWQFLHSKEEIMKTRIQQNNKTIMSL